ncbi:hypothetical protein C8R45DRAFT_1115594 [Mycena sanguinolenta]|nr:hypothetical protein C8R45DRAFT_1115594 [Mycena sanguinolenta]
MPTKYLDFCILTYKPDPGHEDRDVHDQSPGVFYYAIVSKYWSGVLSSPEALAHELKRDHDARTFTPPTWQAAMSWWREDCRHYHNHNEDSTSESSESSSDCSPCSSISAAFPCAAVSAAFTRARSMSPTKNGSQRSVSSRKASVPPDMPSSASPSKIKSCGTPSPTKAITKQEITPTRAGPFPDVLCRRRQQLHMTEYVASKFESWIEAGSGEQPLLLYGVSGHDRIFKNWDRTLAAMKSTPDADLIFSHDEAAIREFVCAEADRMLKESKA